MSKKTFTIFIIIVTVALIGGGYWLYLKNTRLIANPIGNSTSNNNSTAIGNIFSPLAGNDISHGTAGENSSAPTVTDTTSPQNTATVSSPIPTLRELSTTPVGGMAASTTGTTTIVRWINRGTGYVYQALSDSLAIDELSNTTVPMIYQSFWNRNLTAFIFQSLSDGSDAAMDYYTVLSSVAAVSAAAGIPSATSSNLSTNTPYQLRGAQLPSDTSEIAANPENTEVFTLAVDGTGAGTMGTGYISQFDGSKKSQIFSTPLTQLNVQWPTDNTIALTTKGYSATPGFLYFVNPKTGAFSTILSAVNGLDTLTNPDASMVLYSASTGNGLSLSVYNVKAGTSQTLAFNTLPEKCVWSTLNVDDLLCAVPETIPSASYPEAWYQGSVSFTDSLWVINVSTGEVHEIADLLSLAKKSIDAENLTLDPKENFLYFINKNDLTLWSVSLNS